MERDGLLSRLTSVLQLRSKLSAFPIPVAMTVAGFTSVSDWIASDVGHFPFVGAVGAPCPVDWDECWNQAQSKATLAIRDLGWTLVRPNAARRSFEEMFPQLGGSIGPPHPNDLQKEILQIPSSSGPQIIVVEAPMGEGKTEAAFLAADTLGNRGFYIALPTQASSDQTFRRAKDFLIHRFPDTPVHIQLLHGHASVSEDMKALRENARFFFRPMESDDTPAGTSKNSNAIAAEWFTYRKRGLLAPYGIGTIDQVLLADLASRHVFVRLFGLTDKAVVLDEVHAYDIYMTSLMEGLIEWLGALGTSVILLSATLPRTRREALVRAYLKGRGTQAQEVPFAPYPRVTWGNDTGTRCVRVQPTTQNGRHVRLEWASLTIPESSVAEFPLGERLKGLLAEGGRAAVVCNTVRRAQEMFSALSQIFQEDELGLLHSQFVLSDRREREDAYLRVFGKERDVQVYRRILVATQVIEQSLDLDFDVIVTDFAPADLLLQRAGRLHRHPRGDRPPPLREPTLLVCAPRIDSEGVPVFHDREARIYDGIIYDEHVLLRTWLDWRNRTTIRLPEDIEPLVEKVYDESLPPTGLSYPLSNFWTRTRDAHVRLVEKGTYEAGIRRLRSPGTDRLGDLALDPREDDEGASQLHPALQALTRLTQPSQSLIILDTTWKEPSDWGEEKKLPSSDATRALLQRGLTLTHVGAVFALWKSEEIVTPKSWRLSPMLRRYRLVHLKEDGTAQIPKSKYVLCMDTKLGLRVFSS
jgi:CRISPR-associated endonuclease/helicase Cas3